MKHGLKFNGIYQATVDARYFRYLRFYEHGTVIHVMSDKQPEDVDGWFNEENVDNVGDAVYLGRDRIAYSSGKYKIRGNKVKFSIAFPKGKADYKGDIQNDVMKIESYSHITKERGVDEYRFVATG